MEGSGFAQAGREKYKRLSSRLPAAEDGPEGSPATAGRRPHFQQYRAMMPADRSPFGKGLAWQVVVCGHDGESKGWADRPSAGLRRYSCPNHADKVGPAGNAPATITPFANREDG